MTNFVAENVYNEQEGPAERPNRFFDDLKSGKRSLSTDINETQREQYQLLH